MRYICGMKAKKETGRGDYSAEFIYQLRNDLRNAFKHFVPNVILKANKSRESLGYSKLRELIESKTDKDLYEGTLMLFFTRTHKDEEFSFARYTIDAIEKLVALYKEELNLLNTPQEDKVYIQSEATDDKLDFSKIGVKFAKNTTPFSDMIEGLHRTLLKISHYEYSADVHITLKLLKNHNAYFFVNTEIISLKDIFLFPIDIFTNEKREIIDLDSPVLSGIFKEIEGEEEYIFPYLWEHYCGFFLFPNYPIEKKARRATRLPRPVTYNYTIIDFFKSLVDSSNEKTFKLHFASVYHKANIEIRLPDEDLYEKLFIIDKYGVKKYLEYQNIYDTNTSTIEYIKYEIDLALFFELKDNGETVLEFGFD